VSSDPEITGSLFTATALATKQTSLWSGERELAVLEIKSGQTVTRDSFQGLHRFARVAGDRVRGGAVVYRGSKGQARSDWGFGPSMSWKHSVIGLSLFSLIEAMLSWSEWRFFRMSLILSRLVDSPHARGWFANIKQWSLDKACSLRRSRTFFSKYRINSWPVTANRSRPQKRGADPADCPAEHALEVMLSLSRHLFVIDRGPVVDVPE